jgi:NTE family protein
VKRTLVLAGGGTAGIAWEIGVLLGLRDEGVDVVGSVDLVVGTSAGSAVGGQILSGIDLETLYARQLADEHGEINPTIDIDLMMSIFADLMGGALPTSAARKTICEAALAAETVAPELRRAVIEWRLPNHDWPTIELLVTAVDADTGELTVFDRNGGVGLVDAVTASCAVPVVWPVVEIAGHRYTDGGVYSPANAQLAIGSDITLVVTPGGTERVSSIEPELQALRDAGCEVALICADTDALAAMPNPLDPSARAPSARAGRRQGRLAAPELAGTWDTTIARTTNQEQTP